MKKYFIILFAFLFGTCFISCKEEQFLSPEDKDFESGVLVFLDSTQFSIREPLADSDKIKKEKERIKDFAKKNLDDLDIDESNIYLDKVPWFFAQKVNKKQLDKIKKETGKPNSGVLENYPNLPMELQGRKPMMQGDPILQGRKPMMQADWRYDSSSYASDFVLWIGGGIQGTPPADRTVWILDTGIDSTHQDLKGMVLSNEGKSFTGGNSGVDLNGHGTMIAGIIGAKAYNQLPGGDPEDIGINGIVPGARMVSVQILDKDGNSNLHQFTQGLDYILGKAQPNDVVNISLGMARNTCNWGQIGKKIKDLAAKGVFVVFSAGNETDLNSSNFPSCLADGDFMISVGSITMFCNGATVVYSSFSNYGTIQIAGLSKPIWVAPGEQIFSTFPTNLIGSGTDKGAYGLASGTSYSAAMMSGIIYSLGRVPTGIDSVLRGGEGVKYPIAKF
ncbi:S8 family peptidase [Algoriphagus boseongensis]|nr:S8 family serine peptidase [Algoriphagus boseongensis]